MDLGLPRLRNFVYRKSSAAAASRLEHLKRLLNEGRFAAWPRMAEQIDIIARLRPQSRKSDWRLRRFATVEDRDSFVRTRGSGRSSARAVTTLKKDPRGHGPQALALDLCAFRHLP